MQKLSFVPISLHSCWPREWKRSFDFELARLSNENADVRDVVKSIRKLDVSLDGRLLSHTTNLNAFVLSPAVRMCRVRALTERERTKKLPVALFLTSRTSKVSLLKVPYDLISHVEVARGTGSVLSPIAPWDCLESQRKLVQTSSPETVP